MHHLRMIINSPACSRGGGLKLIVDLFQSQIRMHAAQNDCAALRVQLERIFFCVRSSRFLYCVVGWLVASHRIASHHHIAWQHAITRHTQHAKSARIRTRRCRRECETLVNQSTEPAFAAHPPFLSYACIYVCVRVCSVSYMLPPSLRRRHTQKTGGGHFLPANFNELHICNACHCPHCRHAYKCTAAAAATVATAAAMRTCEQRLAMQKEYGEHGLGRLRLRACACRH